MSLLSAKHSKGTPPHPQSLALLNNTQCARLKGPLLDTEASLLNLTECFDPFARGVTLLTTINVPFGVTALTSSGIPTRLLRGALDELTTVISTAPVGVVNEYV